MTPPLSLKRHLSGSTTYVQDFNSDNAYIETYINTMLSDIAGLKAASGAGADLDFRQNAANLLINGGFDYWQRGADERPDGWVERNAASNFAISRDTTKNINTYSAKTENIGQLTQDLPDEIINAIQGLTSISMGIYAKTDVEDAARIGIYNGSITTWSDYHSGGDEWELLSVSYYAAAGLPSNVQFILDSVKDGETVYWNGAMGMRGNPQAGPMFIANDPVIERLRVLSLYETGLTNVRGVGFLNDGDRELEARIEFTSPKRSVPLISIDSDDLHTGYDLSYVNADRHGFNLIASDLGGASGTDGFEIENIEWTAEVLGT